jgi:hypothetical protein
MKLPKLLRRRQQVPDTPPVCERCGLDPTQALSCSPRPGATRFGMEPPGEPGSVVTMASRCPACHVPRGGYHHVNCKFERDHRP